MVIRSSKTLLLWAVSFLALYYVVSQINWPEFFNHASKISLLEIVALVAISIVGRMVSGNQPVRSSINSVLQRSYQGGALTHPCPLDHPCRNRVSTTAHYSITYQSFQLQTTPLAILRPSLRSWN